MLDNIFLKHSPVSWKISEKLQTETCKPNSWVRTLSNVFISGQRSFHLKSRLWQFEKEILVDLIIRKVSKILLDQILKEAFLRTYIHAYMPTERWTNRLVMVVDWFKNDFRYICYWLSIENRGVFRALSNI